MKKIKVVIVLFFSILGHSFGQKVDVERELPPMKKMRVAVQVAANYSTLLISGIGFGPQDRFTNVQAGSLYSSPVGGFGGGATLLLNYPIQKNISVDFGLGLSRFRHSAAFEVSRPVQGDFLRICTPTQVTGKAFYDYYAIDIPIFFQFRRGKGSYFEFGLRGLAISQPSMQKTEAQWREVQTCELRSVNGQQDKVLVSPARVSDFSQNWDVNGNQLGVALGGGIRFRKNMYLIGRASLSISELNSVPRFSARIFNAPSKLNQMTFELGFRYEFFQRTT